MTITEIDLRSFQLGVLKGRGYSDEDIARFEAFMHTEHTARPAGPRIGCAADNDNDRTDQEA